MLPMSHPLQRIPGLLALVVVLMLCAVILLAKADLDRMERIALSRHGPETALIVGRWRDMLKELAALDERQKIERVNGYFNQLARWRQDIDIWQQHDYWATPLELMAKREGDCEDFSIAKYMTLLLAGVDVHKMRITYVKARLGGNYGNVTQAHMVLAYYPTPNADPLILDNMISEVRPASQREDLNPVFGFNSEGLWVSGGSAPVINNPAARLSRWRDLLRRMTADGLG